MSASTHREAPELSVMLTTDTYETIRGVLRRLQQQTAKERVEVVMVVPRGQASRFEDSDTRGFANFQIIELETISPLSRARAEGVRACTAPLVFLGETHAFPHRRWAAEMIAVNHSGHWGAIAPAVGNMNPRSAISWAGFLGDYGPWSEGLPAGEIEAAPLFNSAYQRSALLEFGDRLDAALAHGDELPATMRSRGYRSYFAANARIDHLNITHLKPFLHEHFLTGKMVGGYRGRRWSSMRRLAYVLASPLIPFVLAWRIFSRIRHIPSLKSAPAAAFPLIFLANVVRCAGEAIGYAKGVGDQTEMRAEEYEIHKMAYAAHREA